MSCGLCEASPQCRPPRKGGAAWLAPPAPAVDETPVPITCDIANHECAHAVAGYRYGRLVLAIEQGATLAAGGTHSFCVRFSDQSTPSTEAVVISVLAGPIAQRWTHRCVYRFQDHDLRPLITHARAGTAGECDHCVVFRTLVEENSHRSDDELIVAFRDYELRTIEMVRDPTVWRQITRVADFYRERGHVNVFEFFDLVEAAA